MYRSSRTDDERKEGKKYDQLNWMIYWTSQTDDEGKVKENGLFNKSLQYSFQNAIQYIQNINLRWCNISDSLEYEFIVLLGMTIAIHIKKIIQKWTFFFRYWQIHD